MKESSRGDSLARWAQIVASIATAVALFFIVIQTCQTDEQIEAMWYSMRPIVNISGRTPFQFEPEVNPNSRPYLTETSKFDYYKLSYKIENIGQSTATLDSSLYYVLILGGCAKYKNLGGHYDLYSNETHEQTITLPFYDSATTLLGIVHYYTSNSPVSEPGGLAMEKYFAIRPMDKEWSVLLFPPEEFLDSLQSIPDSLTRTHLLSINESH